MDVLMLHKRAVERYQGYIRSFIDILDDDIRQEVISQLDSGKLWPEPLIQFNPAYKAGASLQALVKAGVLRPELENVFKGYQLYWHQEQALRLGAKKQSFVVTSGTGSGKSLTYLGTAFHSLFSTGPGKGVKALIVYPMNALINSQMEELKKYAETYQNSAGSAFPITFNAYTGQTKNEVRQAIISAPPDVLLTNYMMLELLLTRAAEEQLRHSIFKTLEFLAFDELHTYRGRQGADVSYLIRRIKALAQSSVMCMGTSATMSSRGTFADQKKAVSEVATKIFGEPISAEQVIGEQLERSLDWQGVIPSGVDLAAPIALEQGLAALKSHPLAIWLENSAAITQTEQGLRRCKPTTAGDLIQALMTDGSMPQEKATTQILSLLSWIAAVNKRQTEQDERYTCLPFKLHQFFAQTGSVYATLGLPGARTVTLEPGIYEGADNEFVFPHVFSRASGRTYICVHVDQQNTRFLPREFNDTDPREGNDFGYILPEYSQNEDDVFWNGSQEDLGMLPASWTNLSAAGLKLKQDFETRAPKAIYYNRHGVYAFAPSEECPFKGWYMSSANAGLLFDPTAGLFFEGNTNERTKLTTLGNEGRSTSTTITSFILLSQLAEAGFAIQDQKLLSFTDNRQDAALQSGHFNDFIRIVRIRSAIFFALNEAPSHTLNSTQLGQHIRVSLSLDLSVYSDNPLAFPSERKAIDDCLEKYLTYQAIHDLRRGWRVVLPNLEKCGLLEIDYVDRVENASFTEGWKAVPLFKDLSTEQRAELLRDVLDYFRLEYAITSKTWLGPAAISENIQIIRSKLRPEWTIKSETEIETGALRRKRLHRRNSIQTSSLGLTSALGKYLKHYAKLHSLGVDLSRDGYDKMLDALLPALKACGYVESQELRDADNQPALVYRLVLEKLIWKLGDGKSIRRDAVKQRSYHTLEEKPNAFFRELYQTDFRKLKNLQGADHTGQLSNEDRVDREERFRAEWMIANGDKQVPDIAKINARSLSALFCSPTMELGVDISKLSIVHMRNAPPNPANYAQRSGRAGRSGQAALVFAYCSAYSPHDRHYFSHRQDLVAGAVEPPRLDITNRELIRSHLHAAFMTRVGLQNVRQSALDIIDIAKPALPLRDDILSAITLNESTIELLVKHFKRVLVDKPSNPGLAWCDDAWLAKQLKNLPETLDRAMERWRILYREALATLNKATAVLDSGLYATTTDEHKRAKREIFQGQRQIDLLKNEFQKGSEQSEFYVFRYLAAEGFLPGYNFTRLPIRAFLTDGHEKGEFISRPRLIALREFGPRNVIYYNGQKYVVSQAVIPSVEDNLRSARVCNASGYWLDQGQETIETCPLTGTDLSEPKNKTEVTPLLALTEMIARRREYITCEEEERSRQGFETETYFSLDGGDKSQMRKALVQHGGETLLKMSYLPAARLIQLSRKDRRETEIGYRIGLESGFWNPRDDGPDPEESKRVQLYTETTADALYLQPIEALALDSVGVLSLQYALKRAIELRFQIEPRELGVYAMGENDAPNILFYEASEGSLGVLSAMVDDPKVFGEVIQTAIEVCDFENAEKPKATYDDLLSYYNQPHHLDLDRFSIKDALTRLLTCSLDCSNSAADEDYDSQLKRLLAHMDANSSTEETFLRFLHKRNLRLPDEAQKAVEGIFVKPDFFYRPDTWVFCDGTPHDDPANQADDVAKRKAIKDRGDEVIVYNYKDNLDVFVGKYPDIFKPVR
jgi:hypothetical protein